MDYLYISPKAYKSNTLNIDLGYFLFFCYEEEGRLLQQHPFFFFYYYFSEILLDSLFSKFT